MFVRNNIACPFCGKAAPVDLTVDNTDSFEDFILLRAECYECMSFSQGLISYEAAICLSLAATKLLPSRDRRKRCFRWKASYCWWKHKQRATIWTFVFELLEAGAIDWKVGELPALKELCSLLLRTSVNTIQDISSDYRRALVNL